MFYFVEKTKEIPSFLLKAIFIYYLNYEAYDTVQKMKFSIKNSFSKCDQIHSFLRIWSYLLKKSSMENLTFCTLWFAKFKTSLKLISPKSICFVFAKFAVLNIYCLSKNMYINLLSEQVKEFQSFCYNWTVGLWWKKFTCWWALSKTVDIFFIEEPLIKTFMCKK